MSAGREIFSYPMKSASQKINEKHLFRCLALLMRRYMDLCMYLYMGQCMYGYIFKYILG